VYRVGEDGIETLAGPDPADPVEVPDTLRTLVDGGRFDGFIAFAEIDGRMYARIDEGAWFEMILGD
jgi:hypothetical protein